MSKHKVICCIGTRPEAIKMAPVVRALQRDNDLDCTILATAQHRDMLDQVFAFFDLTPNLDLDLMMPGQTLNGLTAKLINRLDETFDAQSPDLVLAQGDTTTVMATAIVCFHRQIAFGHIEAGLRTGNLQRPFPEEANRLIAGHLATMHFAPTPQAHENLIQECVRPESICLSGNTVIDALLETASHGLPNSHLPKHDGPLILVTAHRRENFGERFSDICNAIKNVLNQHSHAHVLWPVHPNPNVGRVIRQALAGHPRATLCPPLNYGEFVAALKSCHFVLTDSGGVQEEAPALGKPVLVMREESERPEAVRAGVAKLVGTSRQCIELEATRLLTEPDAYQTMAQGASPYGDGQASTRITSFIRRHFNLPAESMEPFAGMPQIASSP